MSSDNDLDNSKLLSTINYVTTILSIIGCFWLSYQCIRIKSKSVATKLIWAISLSDFVYSISNLMAAVDVHLSNGFCQVEGFLRQYSAILSLCFATSTAILSFRTSKLNEPFNQKQFFRKAVWISMTSCLFLSLPPLFMRQVIYGRGSLFCWVKYVPVAGASTNNIETASTLIIVFFEGIPVMLGLTISIFGYSVAIKNYKKFSEELIAAELVYAYRLLWYPAVLFIVFVPSLIDNIVQIYVTAPYWIEAVHLVFLHSIGFINTIVYGVQTRIWTHALDDNNYTELRESRIDEKENSMSHQIDFFPGNY